jgi:hypothetical protein
MCFSLQAISWDPNRIPDYRYAKSIVDRAADAVDVIGNSDRQRGLYA